MTPFHYDWRDLSVVYVVHPAEPDVGAEQQVEITEIYGKHGRPLTQEQMDVLGWAGVVDMIVEAIETEEF